MDRDVKASGRCLRAYLHELLLRALGADDVLCVGDKAFAHERGLAMRADEAVVVPVAVLERDEASAADACIRTEEFVGFHVGDGG